MFYSTLFMFFVLYFCFLFCVFCVSVLFCVSFLLLYTAATYFCTSLPTTATGWKSDSVNKHRIISIRIFYPHILNPGTQSLRSPASRIEIPFFTLPQLRRLVSGDDFACEKKKPPRRKILSPNGAFPRRPVTEPFCARTHTKAQPPSTRADVNFYVTNSIDCPIASCRAEQHDAPRNVILIYQIHLAQRCTAKYSTSSCRNYTTFIPQILLLV
jgi:hypothetical protein